MDGIGERSRMGEVHRRGWGGGHHLGQVTHHRHSYRGQHKDRRNVEDLKKQPYYNFLRKTYNAHIFALAFLLYALGGFPFLVWGMGVRTVCCYHATFLVNSAGHIWGKQVWKTNDLSKNNWTAINKRRQMVSMSEEGIQKVKVSRNEKQHELGHRYRPRRKWTSMDAKLAISISLLHLACVFAPFTFTWPAFWLTFVLYVVTGLFGITLSYHRNLSHRSFNLPKWLEYLFAYCGALAIQRDPISWVSVHRYHHQYVDSEKDPHSPIEGFWFSHMGWLFDRDYQIQKNRDRRNVEDLKKQPFYVFLRQTYEAHLLASAFLLYALGGIPFLVWGMAVRTVVVYHLTFLVNSACHVWGERVWNTNDRSKNNWWVAVLTFGEGWHNNHHAFEYSARQGIEWWQFDPTWYVIRFLEDIGLATNVKLPSEAHKHRKGFSISSSFKGNNE